MKTWSRTTAIGVSVLASVILAAPAWAGAPTDVVKQYTEQVVKVLEDPALKGDDKRGERRATVRKIAVEVFDVNETARRALGRHWAARTPAEREEFVQLFTDLLDRTYVTRIDQYGGEKIKFVGETVDGDNALVKTKLVTKQGTEIPVDGRLLRRNDKWLIYDISIEGVSLVANYRAQFDKIITKSSYAELVRQLKDKSGDLSNGTTAPKRGSS
ncbi:MAG TPA: ABC transporter substrate-binding protein [Methylomirabilota bacterium]|jgi:phospholipid transport system substrate-binding protein